MRSPVPQPFCDIVVGGSRTCYASAARITQRPQKQAQPWRNGSTAIGVELQRLPVLFRLIRKFDRVAVVADKTWVQKVSEIEGAFIPGVVIKGFDPDEEDAAEAWLAES